MVKERSLSCDSAAAWKIQVIVRSGSVSVDLVNVNIFFTSKVISVYHLRNGPSKNTGQASSKECKKVLIAILFLPFTSLAKT